MNLKICPKFNLNGMTHFSQALLIIIFIPRPD